MKEREKLRKSLKEQLKKMGADVLFFDDLIDKYVEFWDIDRLLTEDIENRGVMFTDSSSAGHVMMKNNPSVKEKVMVNRQMLAMLTQLKLSIENVGKEDEDLEL